MCAVQVTTSDGPPVLAVVGPTAAGKSDLAITLAQRLGGQVINADSMQLYRGMDIGTAKLTLDERGGIEHHLLDVWDVTQTASVARYQMDARAVVDRLRAAGITPILVGGSGLYIRAVLDDLQFPGTDPQVRARLEADLAQVGALAMYERLVDLVPDAAARMQPQNGRRIVRALEVVELTGTFTAMLPELQPVYPAVRIGLDVPRPVLDDRIRLRVDRMWTAGLVDEVRRLDGMGIRDGVTASRALGYAQALRYLDALGDGSSAYSEEQAKTETVNVTRRFSRRQDSWFRREPIHWIPWDAPDLLAQALAVAAAPVGAGN